MSPGRPTRVRTVPTSTSAITATRTTLLGVVAQNRFKTPMMKLKRVLESGKDIVGHDIRYQRSILNTSIFSIEPHLVLCGIFQDITQPIFQKEQIIGRARDVIQKNLKTVQQIAYLLGENAADSEIILNSIVRSFTPKEGDDAEEQP